jgi:hypothetical protein
MHDHGRNHMRLGLLKDFQSRLTRGGTDLFQRTPIKRESQAVCHGRILQGLVCGISLQCMM